MPESTRARITVYLLDDDADFRTYIEDLLADEDAYAVRAFAAAAELYAACEDRLPGIVLIDMKMGDITGDTVVEQLLSRYPRLCVIIVTGYPSLEDMRSTFRMKVFDYLPKPFTLAQIRQALQHAAEAYSLGDTPHEALRSRLGQRIKRLRTDRDWGLKELAQSANLSVSQVSSIERGAHMPSIESLLAICRAFGVKPSELLASIEF